jgi:hypothetical protein
MNALHRLLGSATGQSAVLLDPWDYTAHVLDRGAPPMADTAALVSLARRAAGLLRPDGLLLPLQAWFEAELAARGALREAMAQRSRTPFALKTALADESLRRAFRETIGALCAALPEQPLVLALGSSGQWLGAAYSAAHGLTPDDVNDDMHEHAQVYLADLLREIGAVPIGGLFIDEALAPNDDHWLEAFTPVVNICVHYRWSLGVSLREGPGKVASPVGWTVGHCMPGGQPHGVALPDDFWQHGAAMPDMADFYIGWPRPGAQPEAVLAQLAGLRQLQRQAVAQPGASE